MYTKDHNCNHHTEDFSHTQSNGHLPHGNIIKHYDGHIGLHKNSCNDSVYVPHISKAQIPTYPQDEDVYQTRDSGHMPMLDGSNIMTKENQERKVHTRQARDPTDAMEGQDGRPCEYQIIFNIVCVQIIFG